MTEIHRVGGPPGPDAAAITALFGRLCRTWSAGDGHAYGACFTTDCDYVAFDGQWQHGRSAVVDSHDLLFRGVLHGSRLVGEIDSMRALGPDVALVHATASVLVAWRSRVPRRRLTRSTLIAVRGPDGWLFAAANNQRIRPLRIPEPDSGIARSARTMVRAARACGLGRSAPQPSRDDHAGRT